MDTKFTCIVCGYQTLDTRCEWDICPICFWEDDILWQPGDADRTSPANGMTLSAGQDNYKAFGAIRADFQNHVRAPTAHDAIDPNWKPLSTTSRPSGE